MKAIAFLGVATLVVGCATGTYSSSDTSSGGDDGGNSDAGTTTVRPPSRSADGGATRDSGNSSPPPSNADSGSTNNCTGTMCGSACVDVSTDPNNCGACNNACNATSTCTGGKCVSNPTNTSNAPPQGSCAHSLCTKGKDVPEGCDTDGCTLVICDWAYVGDSYCCDTAWDQTCIDEVNTYCAPYSCN